MKLILTLILVLSSPVLNAGELRLKGDHSGLKRVHLMLEGMGGRDVWRGVETIYMMQKARTPRLGDGIVSTRWLNLAVPGERGTLQHPKLSIEFGWDENAGWIGRDGDFRDFIQDEMAQKSFYWGRDVFVLIQHLAEGERELTIESVKPNGFRVFDEHSRKLADFFLTADNQLYRYQQLGGKESSTYIYGPYKSFGQLNFPNWSSSSDGTWGAENLQFLPSNRPFNEQVSLEKPVKEWHGGAVQSNCDP